VQKARKRRKMSAEGRERIRQAQIKRWAALNASKANMNTTVAPLSRRRRSLQRLLDWLLRGMQSIPQPIQRSAARQSREGTSFILARFVWECQSTSNCLVVGQILSAAPRSGKRARWRLFRSKMCWLKILRFPRSQNRDRGNLHRGAGEVAETEDARLSLDNFEISMQ
jgi:hypothetical protein